MDKAYIDRKIEQCQGLVETATSDAQKKIYQKYLDFWISKSEPKGAEVLERTLADEFEEKYAPKQAYYNRDGKKNKTKAFKEYLNQRTQ